MSELHSALALYESGVSIKNIAKQLGRRTSVVSNYLKSVDVDVSGNAGMRRNTLKVGRPSGGVFLAPDLLPNTPETWAYIAGFFDGEGCISFQYDKWSQCRVTIVQKRPQVLEWMQARLGVGNIKPGGGVTQFCIDKQKQVYQFLRGVHEFTIVKRDKVSETLESF